MKEWASELTPDMIKNESIKQIAEEIGVVNLLKVASILGGSTAYIPSVKDLYKPVRNMHIKSEFNGYNYLELVQKYGVTEVTVRNLCRNLNSIDQVSFFDEDET